MYRERIEMLAWNLGHVTEPLLQLNPDKNTAFKSHALYKVAEKLHDSVSFFSRVRITEEQIAQLKSPCKEHFNVNGLFLHKVNPTVWTIGYAVPLHTKEIVQTFSFVLGQNTGCEAKCIKLKKYMENTINVQKGQRWLLHPQLVGDKKGLNQIVLNDNNNFIPS